jgi:HipA-like protein
MRKAEVYFNKILAGELIENESNHFVFRYNESYFHNPGLPGISITLPKTRKEYRSDYLFPFFSNMLAEGSNLAIQLRYLKMDERDILGLLCATATADTIGAVTVKPADSL